EVQSRVPEAVRLRAVRPQGDRLSVVVTRPSPYQEAAQAQVALPLVHPQGGYPAVRRFLGEGHRPDLRPNDYKKVAKDDEESSANPDSDHNNNKGRTSSSESSVLEDLAV
ncbi:unnamed protein product, partial [Urochloa humidicola]